MVHLHINYPYTLDSWKWKVTVKTSFWWNTPGVKELLVRASSFTTPAGIFLSAVVVHVEQQCYNINDV